MRDTITGSSLAVGSPPIGIGTGFMATGPGLPPMYFSSPPPFWSPLFDTTVNGMTVGDDQPPAPTSQAPNILYLGIVVFSILMLVLVSAQVVQGYKWYSGKKDDLKKMGNKFIRFILYTASVVGFVKIAWCN